MLSLDDINKLKELTGVIFRDAQDEDSAFDLLDSEEFATALKDSLDAWDWAEQETILNELREARERFEKDDKEYYIVLFDMVIDAVKERIRDSEKNQSSSDGTTQDGQDEPSSVGTGP